ncbi:uncharacterized protein PFLUO_LOCUS5265 [Penicillium psychrofluorescens]|uniref:uncharacterized protein n=1 Tax=Penicillium psychrofluorescens TaxID=3158075 RepID=UPI003CCE33B3
MLSRLFKSWKTNRRLLSRIPRFSRGAYPSQPLRIDTAASASFLQSVVEDEEEDDDDDDDQRAAEYFDNSYEHQFTNGTSLHSRLVSEPFIPVLNSPPPTQRRATTMALHPPVSRPPPLHIDVDGRPPPPMSAVDPRQPKTPGNKISSFFGWKGATSPGAESSSTEISDTGRSPLSSPMPPLANVPIKTPSPYDTKPNGFHPPVRNNSYKSIGEASVEDSVYASKFADLENELREISSELAGSIRREMELEDLVERLQTEGPEANRRTSDYFSDSGTSSSIRYALDSGHSEDVEKIRRQHEQERAQLKVELAQKLQDERSHRTASESHVQILETQVQQLRRERVDLSDLSSKTRELETALENTRRKLIEERQSKDNFEDLLTAMRVELNQLRDDRDQLRDGDTPQAVATRLMEENEALKIENAALAQLQGSRFASISEDGAAPKRNSVFGGLGRSNSVARMPGKSGGLSRSNSVTGVKESREGLVEKVKEIETQRDALHRSLRSLLDRQAFQARDFEKRTRILELELIRTQDSAPPRRLGYEREVRNLREEVSHLRQRAEDAMDGKWQCEKNLAGLKMDLDRAEQETTSLRVLLQEHDVSASDATHADEVLATSSSLESAYQQLQTQRNQAEGSGANSQQLVVSIQRTDALGNDVNHQLQMNSSLRERLANAINKGERDQQCSTERINILQNRLKGLEDSLVQAQQYSEEEMSKHEEQVRQLRENHNSQLMRMKNGSRDPVTLSPRPPNTPFGARSPRLEKTTSGDGIALTEVIQPEALEKQVKQLERALRDADMEMEEVIGRMNRAQIEVAELQAERDEALRQTRRLQTDIQAERDAFKSVLGY